MQIIIMDQILMSFIEQEEALQFRLIGIEKLHMTMDQGITFLWGGLDEWRLMSTVFISLEQTMMMGIDYELVNI